MGLLSSAIESRSTVSAHPRDPVFAEWFGGGVNTAAGIAVTPDSAMRESAVYACVRVLAESVAQLPLHVYRRRKSGGKDKATDHPLYEILHSTPNDLQTSFGFREMTMAAVLLRGNSVAKIVPRGGSAVGRLEFIEPNRVSIRKTNSGKRVFVHDPEFGSQEILLPREVFHVAGMTLDGFEGISPIAYHRETVGASLAVKEFGSRLFANGTHIGTVLEHPEHLSQTAHDNIKRDFQEKFAGIINANKPFILEEGMKLAKIGMTPEDAQYLDTRKFARSEIAGIFRVPPHMIADLQEATFSNIEQQAIDFVVSSLVPWLVRIEQSISRDLFSAADRKRGYFAEFNVMGLLRGDATARANYYKARFETGSITPNQIRALENENPEDGGDESFVPLNMIPIGQAGRSEEKGSRFSAILARVFRALEMEDEGHGTAHSAGTTEN